MLCDSFNSFWLWCCFMLILKSGSSPGQFWVYKSGQIRLRADLEHPNLVDRYLKTTSSIAAVVLTRLGPVLPVSGDLSRPLTWWPGSSSWRLTGRVVVWELRRWTSSAAATDEDEDDDDGVVRRRGISTVCMSLEKHTRFLWKNMIHQTRNYYRVKQKNCNPHLHSSIRIQQMRLYSALQ